MSVGEGVARTLLQVAFELGGFLAAFQGNISYQMPRFELGRMGICPRVVAQEAGLDVFSQSNISLLRTGFAAQEVDVMHVSPFKI